MADDIQSNIRIDIDATSALASLKNLQRQISAFHTSMIKGSADAAAASALYQQKLVNAINRTGQFSAEITKVASSSESFTTALEKNKLSMGEYFRYAGGASRSFGKMFKSEFRTIEKTAIERVKTLQTQYISLGRDANGALKSIKIKPLALDMKDLSVQTQIAAQKTQILNKLMMQGSTNLLNFGKNTQWAGRQLMVGFTVPLTMLGSVASKTFMEMEEQVIKFKRVYGETFTTSAETNKMVEQIRGLANEFTKYGVAVADTMAMAADAAAQGKMGADLLAQVTQATKLATLGNVEQQQALETTISITNAFGIASEDLADKINFLNAVENQTVTSIEDLTVAIPKAGPVIKQLGGSVEDLAFFLTAMKEGGINASEGANALKSGLASMINPTRQASEFMAKFGISISGIVEGNKGDVKGMVIGLAQALDKLDPLNRARAIEQMFGKFQFARISTLLQNVTKDSSQANRVLGLTKASAAELAVLSQRELSKMEASPMYKFQKAVEDLKTSLVPLGEAFLKAITPVIEFAKGILDRFNALDEGAKSFVTNLVGIVGVIGPAFLMGFGLVANGVANVIKLFTNMKMAYNRALDSTNELGVQTDYMTQAELEASAAAASLEQSHSTLIQTFNVEAAALSNLTLAYEKAIAAQNVFAGSNPGMFPGGAPGSSVPDGTGKRRGQWKGYAEGGIIRGPGTGTSDSIPAMLSNGEAVIPAENVAKFPDLVRGLISGKIGKFSQGTPEEWIKTGQSKGGREISIPAADMKFINEFSDTVGKTTKVVESLRTKLVEEFDKFRNPAANRKLEKTPEEIATEIKSQLLQIAGDTGKTTAGVIIGKLKESGARDSYSRPVKEDAWAHLTQGAKVSAGNLDTSMFSGKAKEKLDIIKQMFPGKAIDLKGGWGMQTGFMLNQNMDKQGASTQDVITDMQNRSLQEKWGTSVKIGGGNFSELRDEIAAFDADIQAKLQAQLALGKDLVVDSRTQIEEQRKVLGSSFDESRYIALEDVVNQAIAALGDFSGGLRETALTAQDTITSARFGWSNEEQQQLAEAGNPLRLGIEKYQGAGSSDIAGRKKGGMARGLSSIAGEQGLQDASSYSEERNAVLKQAGDMALQTRQRNSPHPSAPQDGKDDATAYLQSRNEILNAKDMYPSQPIPGVTPPGAPGSSKLPTPPTLGSIPGVEAPKTVGGKKPGFVAKLAAKGAEAAGSGIDALKDKVNQVGQNLVDKWNAKIDQEAQASIRLSEQRMQLADQLLMATDEEFVALEAQRTMLIQKGQQGQQLSQEEMALYNQTNELLREKKTALAQEMEQTGLEGENVKQRIINAEQRGVAISEEQRNAVRSGATGGVPGGEGPVNRREQSGKSILKNLSKASMVLSTVSMGVSMIPGEIGKQAQQLMGPLMAMSAVLPMLSSKMGAATIAVGALIGAFMWLKGSMDEARTKGFEMAEALGAGEKNIKKLAEFAGKASAGEIASKMREDKFGQFEIKSGKKTFGESFIEGDAGKAMLAAVKDVVAKGGGREMAKNQLFGQLTTGVASGALSAAQARSIAANIGEELGDMSFGIQVNAKMISLLGPNGENLAKDPVGVRVAILEQSRRDMGTQIAAMNKQQVNPGGAILGGAGGLVAGAGVGAASALAIGAAGAAAGTAAFPVVGTIIGAVTGLIAGAVVGSIEENKRIAQQAGSLVAMQQMALQQQQEMVDSLDLDYQKRIEIARQAGKVEEAERLTNEHIIARGKLFDEQGKLMGQITQSYVDAGTGFLGGEWFSERAAMNQAADDAIRAKYKEGPMASIAESAISGVKNAAISDEADYTLRVAMSTGDIDPMAMLIFTNTYGQDSDMMNKTVSVMTKFGTVFLGEAMQAMNLFVNPDGSPIKEQQTEFMMKIDSMTSTEAQEYVNLLANVAKTGSVVPIGISTTFYQNNPEAADEIQTTIADLEKVKDENFDIDAAVKVIGQDDMATLLSDAEYFNKLPKKQRKVYVQVMDTLLNLEGDPAMMTLFNNWVKEQGDDKLTFKDYVKFLTQQVTETVDTTKGTETPETTGGGGGPSASPIDDYLKKLRDLRNELVKVPTGFAASMKEINKWFGGNKTIKVYDGLKNQMRGLGLDEGLIETLIGMDPAEFEKQKKKLFTLDARGMIKGLTSAGKELREAADSVTMGTWNDQMESQTKLTQDQQKAFSRLTKAGMSVADAYDTIQDAALAQALASKNVTDADIAGRVKLNNEMKAGLRLMAAMTELEKRNSAVKDTTKLLRGLNKPNNFGFNPEDMQKILADDVMREAYTAMIQPNVKPEDAKRLQKVIEDALKMANLTAANDLILKYKSGLTGLEQIFNEGFDKAMESFSVRERKLQLQADVDMKPFNDVIEAAQDSIAAIEYQIDDYDAGLKRIADKEELINKAYDDKLEALDKVQQANEVIARQQRNQLSLADALASGDIAAAARAAQEIRQQDAQDALDRQRDTLEKARKSELEGQTAMVTVGGKQVSMNRKQIEDAKKVLEDRVFNIQETDLEPAQEQIRQIQARLREDIQAITVEGKTKTQWEQLGNSVDFARVTSEKFTDAMKNATTVVEELISAWGKEKGMTIAEAQAIIDGTSLAEVAGEAVAAVRDTQTNNTSTSSSSSSSGSGEGDGKPDKPTTPPATGKMWSYDEKTNSWKQVNDPKYVKPVTPTVGSGEASGTLMKAQGSDASSVMFDNFGKNSFWQGKLDKAHSDVAAKEKTLDSFKDKLGVDSYDFDKGKSFYLKKMSASDTAGRASFTKAWDDLKEAKATRTSFDNGIFNQNNRAKSTGAIAFMDEYSKNMPTWLKNNLDILKNKGKQYVTDHDAIKAAKAARKAVLDKYAFAESTTKEQFAASAASKEDKAKFPGLYDAVIAAESTRNKNRKLVEDVRAYLLKQGITAKNSQWYLGLGSGSFDKSYVNEGGYNGVLGYASGGMVIPKKFANGGYASGTDTVPAMLTPGEFVVRKFAVDSFGADRLEAINAGIDPSAGGTSNTSIIGGDSLYNYNVNVNVRSDADPNAIARTVMEQLRRVDSQRIRSTRV